MGRGFSEQMRQKESQGVSWMTSKKSNAHYQGVQYHQMAVVHYQGSSHNNTLEWTGLSRRCALRQAIHSA